MARPKTLVQKIAPVSRVKVQKKNSLADINANTLNNLNLAAIIPQQQGLTKNQIELLNQASSAVLLTNNRIALTGMYKNSGVVQAMIDQPVDDAFRGGIIIKTPEEDFTDEMIAEIQFDLKNESVLRTYAQGEKWARLFGGAGIIIDVEGQEPEKPFKIEQLRKGQRVSFYAADLWELNTVSPGTYGEEKPYIPEMAGSEIPYTFYGEKLHKSRVIKLIGKEAPSQQRTILRGWGLSLIESMVDPLANYYDLNNLSSNYIDQACIDIFKIFGLNDALAMADGGAQAIVNKAQTANMLKNINNGLVIDKEDEFIKKQISFASLPELREQNRIELGASTRMPLTKTYGISSPSFNNGEDGLENYNGMVESTIRTPSEFKLIKIVQIMCQLRFGKYPKRVDIGFTPLRVLTTKEEGEVKSTKLDNLIRLYDRGIIGREELIRQSNAANITTVAIDPTEPVGKLVNPPPQKPTLDLYGDDSRERNKLK